MKKNVFYHSQKSSQEISIETAQTSKCLKSFYYF